MVSASDQAEFVDRCLGLFRERFGPGADPRAFFAPGRVNLLGEHVDYNHGLVLPAAIDRGTVCLLRLRGDRTVRLASADVEGELAFEAASPVSPTRSWADYPLGVFHVLGGHLARCQGADLLFAGDLPREAGLASSASLTVAAAFALREAFALAISQEGLAEAAYRAERDFVGLPCGIMDPFASALAKPGAALLLDCRDGAFEHIPLAENSISLAIADTSLRRRLAAGEAYGERVRECADALAKLRRYLGPIPSLRDVEELPDSRWEPWLEERERRRVRHVVGEIRRVRRAAAALRAGDVGRFGELLVEGHRSASELYEVSSPELDFLVEEACKAPGTLGARLTGAGFGGCIVVAGEPGFTPRLLAALPQRFRERFATDPLVFPVRAAGGPRELLPP